MRFTILGSGTSAGVPVIGCDCAVCRSDDPRDTRTRPSACLEFTDADGKERLILLDTSPDLREQALRHDLRRCDAILLTHHHVDHIFGLDEVRRFNALMNEPIPVFAEPRTMGNVQRVFKHIFDSQNNVNPSFVATLIPQMLAPEVPFEFLGLRITPLRLHHGRLPILGFRFDRLVPFDGENDPLPLAYCTDVSSIPPETWPQLTGLSTLILDALRPRHHPTHFNFDQATEAAMNIGASQTFFTHMTHDKAHADMDAQLPDGIALSYDGMTLGVD